MVSLNKAKVINITQTRKKNGIYFYFSDDYMTKFKVLTSGKRFFNEWTNGRKNKKKRIECLEIWRKKCIFATSVKLQSVKSIRDSPARVKNLTRPCQQSDTPVSIS